MESCKNDFLWTLSLSSNNAQDNVIQNFVTPADSLTQANVTPLATYLEGKVDTLRPKGNAENVLSPPLDVLSSLPPIIH